MKRFIGLAMAMVMSATMLAGCGSFSSSSSNAGSGSASGSSSAQTSSADAVTLKLTVESAVGTPGDLSANDFKTMVEEKSNGSIKVEYYPAGQVGTGDDLTELMQTGSVDMSWRAIDWYSKFENGWNILLMGFLFKDEDHVYKFLESDKEQELKDALVQDAGLRMLTDKGVGAPRVLISKNPVNSPDDLKGINVRVPGIEMYQKTWSGLGANCISVAWGDSYMALNNGTVDALESPLGSIYGMAFYEAAKNITYTNHVYSPYVMVINENSYQKLSEEQQQIITECAEAAADKYVEYDKKSVEENVQAMVDEGVVINENPDIEAFQEKLAPVAEECEKQGTWPEGLYDYVQGLE